MTVNTQALAQQTPAAQASGLFVRYGARALRGSHRALNRIVDRMFAFELRPEEVRALEAQRPQPPAEPLTVAPQRPVTGD